MNIGHLIEEFIVYLIPSVTVIYFVIGLVFFKDSLVNYFSLVMFAAAIYSLAFFIEKMSAHETTAFFVRKFAYPSVAYIPAFGLLFIIQLTSPERIKIILISALYTISSAFGLLFLTNDSHNLFFTNEIFIREGKMGTVVESRGPAFFALIFYFVLTSSISSILLWKKSVKTASHRIKRSLRFLFFATLIPWIPMLLIILDIDMIDPIPFTIMLVVMFLGMSETKHGIFKGYLSMWKNSHNSLEIPSVLVDEDYEAIVSNSSYDYLDISVKKAALGKIKELIMSNRYKGEICSKIEGVDSFHEITQSVYNIKQRIYSVFISDITEDKKHQEEIYYLSFYDQLTGLSNRSFFEREMHKIDKIENLPICFIMIDVNGLKLTNDAFGQITGDELLITLADTLRKNFDGENTIARVGGDEFVVCMPKTEIDVASRKIEKLNTQISNKKIRGISISIAVGFSAKTDAGQLISETIKQAEDQMYRNKLHEDLSMRSKIIDIVMNTLYEKNKREMQHSERVGDLSEKISLMMNISENEAKQIKIAGRMHDIGKIGIDEYILNDPKSHNEELTVKMQKHPEIGYRLLSSVNEFSGIAKYVLEHHEKWDGTGYPKGLTGEEISLPARIIAVADAFDAITNDRPYRRGMSAEEALIELTNHSGRQFDPVVIDALQRMAYIG